MLSSKLDSAFFQVAAGTDDTSNPAKRGRRRKSMDIHEIQSIVR